MRQPRLPELDALDLQLLTLLEEDGRMALSALARKPLDPLLDGAPGAAPGTPSGAGEGRWGSGPTSW